MLCSGLLSVFPKEPLNLILWIKEVPLEEQNDNFYN